MKLAGRKVEIFDGKPYGCAAGYPAREICRCVFSGINKRNSPPVKLFVDVPKNTHFAGQRCNFRAGKSRRSEFFIRNLTKSLLDVDCVPSDRYNKFGRQIRYAMIFFRAPKVVTFTLAFEFFKLAH